MILALNCGSSTLKYALFDGEKRVQRGIVDASGGLQAPGSGLRAPATTSDGFRSHAEAVHTAFEQLQAAPEAVGHRIVHGGPSLAEPVRVDDRVLSELRRAAPFAPLHLPAAIAAIEAVSRRFPGLPQVACFDTAFHRKLPEVARRFPLPETFFVQGVQRYGFHGLSYEWAASQVRLPSRAILAHLGNGASMCAVRDGVSVDTTMGLTPAGGFMMGTRSGDLDPGVLLFLLQHKGMQAAELERLIDRQSGLFGVSGQTPDMQALLASEDPRARLAVEMFCYQARKTVGALAAALGGVEMLVFTGGIGEHAAEVRARICQGLGHLGIRLEPARNARSEAVISAEGASCAVRIVAANEELVIARHVQRMVG